MPGTLIAMGRLNRPSLMIYGGTIKPGMSSETGDLLDIVSAFQSYGMYACVSAHLSCVNTCVPSITSNRYSGQNKPAYPMLLPCCPIELWAVPVHCSCVSVPDSCDAHHMGWC